LAVLENEKLTDGNILKEKDLGEISLE